MNAIEDNAWRRSWQAMGTELLARAERPQLILCISAHWLTKGGWQITGMARPKTIHDFGGFPQALFDQQYPAPGAPAVASSLANELKSPTTGAALGVDLDVWGLDHGTWSVLKPMFPKADIPVLQLSMDYGRPAAEHYALGRQLQALR
jgi:4,5-DOPA dioxygenase extradiol